MSRAYAMSVEITGHKIKLSDAIFDACRKEWNFDSDNGCVGPQKELALSGESSLCGGESEDEFAQRLAAAIWIANGGFCQISVRATCLEYIPSEFYEPTRDDYRERVKGNKQKTR